MADLVGQQFGNYRLTTLLGSGGFADVYLGEHIRLGMQAALKVLHAHLVGGEAEAFQAEARIISELIHPHIIRVLDFDIERGTPFLVLDYAPQGSLSQRHKRGTQVPLPQVITYVEQVADALQYAHDRKLIHRDVKPANMLVGRQGEVLLSDFGIASIAHSTSSMRTESPLGTLAYMAPEQLQGHVRATSDQYSLAVTVYQWLSGDVPFRGSSMEIVGQQLGATPAPLRNLVPTIAPAVEQVVLTALSKDPHARFQTVRAFADELGRASQEREAQTFSYTATTVVEPRPKTPPKAIQPPFQRDPGGVAPGPLVVPDPVLPATRQDTQTPRPASAQTQVNTAERSQPASYLQPAVPYIPPAERPRVRSWWIVLWQGSVLGICMFVVNLIGRFPLLPTVGVLVLLSFAGGVWSAQRTGLLRSGIFTSLLIIFWLSFSYTPPFELYLSNLLISAVPATVCGFLGGLIGRYIYHSRQPIHPPAGGSNWR